MGGSTSAPTVIQAHFKNIKPFMLSMSGTNPLFSDSLQHPNILLSQANTLHYFCFFTRGKESVFRFWQLKQFFVCSLVITNPPIKQNCAIVHQYKEMKFLSIYLDPVAFSNMIMFMDNIPDKLTREDFISRMALLYKNQDPILCSNITHTNKIRPVVPTLKIAEPILFGQSPFRQNRINDKNSTSVSNVNIGTDDISSSIVMAKVNDVAKEQSIFGSANISSTMMNPISEPSSILNESTYASYSTNMYSTTTNMYSSTTNTTTYESDTQQSSFSSFANSISEPGPYESSLSVTFKELKNEEDPYLHKHHNLNNDSESITVSESFLSQSTIAPNNDESYGQLDYSSSSQYSSSSHSSRRSTKEQSRQPRRPRRHKKTEDDSTKKRRPRNDDSSVSYSESVVTPQRSSRRPRNDDSSVSYSESIDTPQRSARKRKGDDSSVNYSESVDTPQRSSKKHKGDDDSSSRQSVYSFRKNNSVSSGRKLHIFTDENDDKDENDRDASFVSESVMSSNGNKSNRKRNVGVEIDFHHDVGFTSSEASFDKKSKSSRSSRSSKIKSNRGSTSHKSQSRSSRRAEYSSEITPFSVDDSDEDADTNSLED